MSCQIRSVANIVEIDNIKKCLFPTSDIKVLDNWLQQCYVSLSPIGDIIALVRERRLVILNSRWDSLSSLSQYQTVFSDVVHEVDNATAVLCLPIVGQSKSSHVSPDWTAIMVGFESGYVRVYMETGELLYEEQFHNESITSIKCQSQHNPRPDISPELHTEEIYIQYQSNVCLLSGNQLFPVLRISRAQYARAQAHSDLLEITQPTVSARKWGFQEQSVINDIAVVGLSISNAFDHLLTASTCGGFESKFRSMPPNNTLVLAAGSKPYLGFHFAIEGSNQPVLSDVAKAVAHKLKSALPSWLTGTSQVEKRPSVSLQPVDQMGCRFGLCDLYRTANVIILSPNHKLAAIADSLGRVTLIDTDKGVVLKILKGYRDAQCAFIQVPDERRSKHRIGNKVALFLVVYSAKKGTLEIFTTQQCVKITTFSAARYSRLLYINYGLMGFSQPTKSKYLCQFTTVFIDNDGKIKEIMIPFHFALGEKNNKKGRDIHLYKKLKQLIKFGNCESDTLLTEALNICKEMKTVELKTQMMELLSTSRNIAVEIILKCAQYFIDSLSEEDDKETTSHLRIKVRNIVNILNFYLFAVNSVDRNENSSKDKDESSPTFLKLDQREVNNLQKLLDLSTINDKRTPSELKVTFSDEEPLPVSEFLSMFNLNEESNITLKSNQDETNIYRVSEALFDNLIGKLGHYEFLGEEILKSNINIKDLCSLLITYWVNRPLRIHLDLQLGMNNLANILYILIKNSGDIFSESDALENFWSEVRDILCNCNRPFPAMTAAIICKYVAFKIETEKDLDLITLDDDEIEIWSQENIEWALLIGKLEDVSLLHILIMNKPSLSDNCPLPKLYHENIDVSLKYVLQRKGSVSELVARWLTLTGIDPEYIVINDKVNKPNVKEKNIKTCQQEDEDEEPDQLYPEVKIHFIQNELLFEHLNMMRSQWPYSLEASMLLTNMSWEYAVEWKKNIQNLNLLEACISCLKGIPNFFVRLGLFNLIWKTYLNILFEATTKLLNKVGKVPKERLCMQDTGLSDLQIPIFIGICTDFLDTFTDTVQEMYIVPKEPLNFEPIWENGGQPLVELAIQQTNINYDLLLAHYQLSLVFQILCTFSIKSIKPINNLFDSEVIDVFYRDFQEKTEVDYSRTDSRLTAARIQFLTKVITLSIENITVKNGKPYMRDHVFWMSKCRLLGLIWDLDIDVLRKHQVVQLFTHGYNVLAQDLSGAVNDRNKLGVELLELAGRRMSKHLAACTNIGRVITSLSPIVTRYMESLKKDWCADSTLKDIIDLTMLSLTFLDEKQHQFRIAKFLLEETTSLRNQGEEV